MKIKYYPLVATERMQFSMVVTTNKHRSVSLRPSSLFTNGTAKF